MKQSKKYTIQSQWNLYALKQRASGTHFTIVVTNAFQIVVIQYLCLSINDLCYSGKWLDKKKMEKKKKTNNEQTLFVCICFFFFILVQSVIYRANYFRFCSIKTFPFHNCKFWAVKLNQLYWTRVNLYHRLLCRALIIYAEWYWGKAIPI